MPDAHLLHVICHRPGLHRGGRVNPAHASYNPGVFTAVQLAELAFEPEITLIVGRAPDHEDLAGFASEPAVDKKAKK